MTDTFIIAAWFAGLLLFLGALGAAVEWRKSKRKRIPWTPAKRKEVVGAEEEPDEAEKKAS